MKHSLTLTVLLAALCSLVFSVTGCSSAMTEDELLSELANLDKEAIFNRAEELYEQEEYKEARRYFSFVYDTFPNDPLGHKAALKVADTYALKKDSTSLTEARLRYRDFANRYPNDPDRDYALLKLGQTYAAKNLRPDRDLSAIEEALSAYNQLITLYPNSPYHDEALEQVADLREIRAQHEFQVATFYYRNNRWRGVMWRLEYLVENYPDFSEMDEVHAMLEEASSIVTARDEAIAKYREALAQRDEEKGED